MNTLYALSRIFTSERARAIYRRAGAEAKELALALVSPNKLVAEVEAMRALHVEAARIGAPQPRPSSPRPPPCCAARPRSRTAPISTEA